MNRKTASAKTAITVIILQMIAVVFGFINQRIFLSTLGIEYTGINGVYGNIMSILTLSDLGVGTAVIFHLYKALAKKDDAKVSSLLRFYQKACHVVTAIVFLGGALLLPFARIFVGETTVTGNLYLIFSLFIITASLQYLFNYKRALLLADQRGYLVNTVMIITTTCLYFAKIAVLLATSNIYLYLLTTIIEKLVENLVISRLVSKNYHLLKNPQKLDSEIKTDIKKKMYASVYHNAASYVVNFTDNTIIAQIFGSATAGLYVNYFIIIQAISTLLNQLLNSVVASLGNLLASEGIEKFHRIVKNLFFLNFWVYSVVCLATYFCLTPFVTMWIGAEYLLPPVVVIAIVINLFVQGLRSTAGNVLQAAGIIYENRFVPVAEAVINLSTSIFLALLFGLPGVFIGTILSNLFLHLYSYPKYAWQHVLKRPRHEYIFLFAKYLAIFILSWLGLAGIFHFVNFSAPLPDFVFKGALSIAIPSVFYTLIFFRTAEFRYFADLLKNLAQKLRR